MTYREAVRWLDDRVNYERSGASRRWRRLRNLGRIRRLLAAVGDPHRSRPGQDRNPGPVFIHIAGTKGKGSTAHLFAAALQALGFRVGLYTSPHVAGMRERIRVDGEPIPGRRLAAHLGRLRRALRAGPLRREPPTYFDLLTAAAFLEFRARGTAWAVVETGLGGRLDSTNVVRPALAVLTNVDLDHTDVLGRTRAAIAREKAGIVKPGVPLVRGAMAPAAARVVEAAARRAGAPVWASGRDLRLGRVDARGLAGTAFDARTPRRAWRGMRLAVPGRHQAENALLVLGGLDRLEAEGRLRADPARVRRALARVRIPARLQACPGRPALVVDGAHNPMAARAVAAALEEEDRRRPRGRAARVLLFAAARDKDARPMLRALARVADAVVVARVDHPRMRSLPDLLRQAGGIWPAPPVGAGSPEEALRLARGLAGPSGRVLATGSFYLAGALLQAVPRALPKRGSGRSFD
jgi:dihydrofolate synthase/folylpolyglutamate synthase